jgi:hypothetical protein
MNMWKRNEDHKARVIWATLPIPAIEAAGGGQ